MTNPLVIGRCEVVGQIGREGIGALYRAWDPKLERPIVITILDDDNEELRERSGPEACSAGRLRHPHIASIFNVGEHHGRPFLTMEYIEGRNGK